MDNRGIGFYDVLKARRDEMDVLQTVLRLQYKVDCLETEISEVKTLLVKSMQQMQEIYLRLLKEPSKPSETNDVK